MNILTDFITPGLMGNLQQERVVKAGNGTTLRMMIWILWILVHIPMLLVGAGMLISLLCCSTNLNIIIRLSFRSYYYYYWICDRSCGK